MWLRQRVRGTGRIRVEVGGAGGGGKLDQEENAYQCSRVWCPFLPCPILPYPTATHR